MRALVGGHLAIAGALAMAAAVACAQEPEPRATKTPASGWWTKPRTVAELKLTAEQQKAIEAAENAHKNSRATAMKGYAQAYDAFLAELSGAAAGSPAVEKRRGELLAAWAALGAANVEHLVVLRAILTNEQMARLPKVAPGALRMGPIATRGKGAEGRAAHAEKP